MSTRKSTDFLPHTIHSETLVYIMSSTDINLDDNKIGIISLNNTEFTVKRFDKKKEMLIQTMLISKTSK